MPAHRNRIITGGTCHKYEFCLVKRLSKDVFVATKQKTCLSRQNKRRVCHDKTHVCRDKNDTFWQLPPVTVNKDWVPGFVVVMGWSGGGRQGGTR